MGHQLRLQASQSRCENSSPHTEPGCERGPSPQRPSLHAQLEQWWQAPGGTGQVIEIDIVLDSGAMYPLDRKMRVPVTGHQVWEQPP